MARLFSTGTVVVAVAAATTMGCEWVHGSGSEPLVAVVVDSSSTAEVAGSISCPSVCNDGNACSDDICKGGVCVFLPNAATCSDGNACTTGDACSGLGCKAGKSLSCDDGQACTVDTCDLANGCTATATKDGTGCEDGIACTVGQTCKAGKCTAGSPRIWTQSPPSSADQYGVAVAESGKDLVFGGTLAGNPWLRRTSGAGEKLWDTDPAAGLPNLQGGQVTDLHALAGGAVIAAGHVDLGGQADGFLARIAEDGAVDWRKTYGGAKSDGLRRAVPLTDGYLLAGTNSSKANGARRGWVVRTDLAGAVAWERTFAPGVDTECGGAVGLSDGFALVGTAAAAPAAQTSAPWVLRLNTKGHVQWQRSYASATSAEADDVVAVGGGLLVAGATADPKDGMTRAWLARLDDVGNVSWQRWFDQVAYLRHVRIKAGMAVLAGAKYAAGKGHAWIGAADAMGNLHWQRELTTGVYDAANGLAEVSGGWAVAGVTREIADKPIGLFVARTDWYGHTDCLGGANCAVVAADGCADGKVCTVDTCAKGKCDNAQALADGASCDDGVLCTSDGTCTAGKCLPGGAKLFAKTYGNTGAYAVAVVPDGFAALGRTCTASGCDMRLVKLDKAGNQAWAKDFGGAGYNEGLGLLVLGDGFLCSGINAGGGADGWLLKTNPKGEKIWSQTYGGAGIDHAYGVVQAGDGYVFAGHTTSLGAGKQDAWVVGTDAGGKLLWQKTIGGPNEDSASGIAPLADGFALAGNTASTGAGQLDAWLVRCDSNGNLLWDRTYGGVDTDHARHVLALPDGFAMFGETKSKGGGAWDLWLIRTDSMGNLLWDRTFGGIGVDYAGAFAVVADGFVLTGGKTIAGKDLDAWIVHTDAKGNLTWNDTWGGPDFDFVVGLAVLPDGLALGGSQGGVMAIARTDAFGHKTCEEAGSCADLPGDACADGNPCTLDKCMPATGNCDWGSALADGSACDDGDPCTAGDACGAGSCAKGGAAAFEATYGGAKDDSFYSVVALPDGVLLVGWTDVGAGNLDAWLVRRNAMGATLWAKSFGGSGFDEALCAAPMADGNFIVSGITDSSDLADGKKTNGGLDLWLFKVNADGAVIWNQTMGGSGTDQGCAIATADGGFAVAGSTNSTDLKSGKKPAGGYDVWLLKLTKDGAVQWEQLLGGGNSDLASSSGNLVQLPDGGFAISAWTTSASIPGGGTSAGGQDFWLLRTDNAGALKWAKTYGGTANDRADGFAALADGGFALIGYTYSATLPQDQKSLQDDVWVVRTDSQGKMLWNRAYGGTGEDWGAAIVEMAGGDLAWVGRTGSVDLPGGQKMAGVNDIWVTRTDPSGTPLWSRTFGGAELDIAYGLARTPNDGLTVGGMTASAGAGVKGGWLLRLDPWGNPTCTACAGLAPADCDDGNPKTIDLCDPAKGCVHLPQ